MDAKSDVYNSKLTSFVLTLKDKVVDLDDSFLKLVEYSKEEIINKEIDFCFKQLFRLTCNIDVHEKAGKKYQGFIFSKSLDVREVIISTIDSGKKNEKIYIIKEKYGTSLETRFSYITGICENNLDGIAVYSVEPRIVLLKASQKYFDNYDEPFNDRRNCIGRCIEDFITGWKSSKMEESWKYVLSTGQSIQYKELNNERFNKRIGYVRGFLMPLKIKGEIRYVVENLADISEQVESHKMAITQKEQLEALIENMSDGLFIIDKDNNYLMCNEAAKEIVSAFNSIDKTCNFLKSYTCYDINGNKLTKEKLPVFRVLGGERIIQQRIILQSSFKKIYLDISCTPFYDGSGKIPMAAVCTRDVTQRVNYGQLVLNQQKMLFESEKNEKINLEKAIKMKDEFFSLISHEFKTPITVVNSAIQAMEVICKDELSQKAKGFLSKIKQNSFRQLRLVNNLLDITRLNAGHLKTNKKNLDIVFLTKAITESVNLYAQQKNIKLVFTSTFRQRIIGIDEEKYERILLNLLSNAIKFTSVDKSITVKVGSKNGFARIEIKDEGIGVPKNKQELIFERFGQVDSSFSRQAEGSGIGLSLVKLLVEAMGGSITIKSKVGKGSTFTVLLPTAKVQVDKTEKKLEEITDNRLIQATAIEFSDIYL